MARPVQKHGPMTMRRSTRSLLAFAAHFSVLAFGHCIEAAELPCETTLLLVSETEGEGVRKSIVRSPCGGPAGDRSIAWRNVSNSMPWPGEWAVGDSGASMEGAIEISIEDDRRVALLFSLARHEEFSLGKRSCRVWDVTIGGARAPSDLGGVGVRITGGGRALICGEDILLPSAVSLELERRAEFAPWSAPRGEGGESLSIAWAEIP